MIRGSPSMPLSVALLEMNVNEGSAGGAFPCVYNQWGIWTHSTKMSKHGRNIFCWASGISHGLNPLASQKARHARQSVHRHHYS